jgi:hypothetical protein
MEFQNVGAEPLRVTFSAEHDAECRRGPFFSFLPEVDGVIDYGGLGTTMAFQGLWRSEALTPPGGSARRTVLLEAPFERWRRRGALLRLCLLGPGHREGFWEGKAISGGVPFPPIEDGPAEKRARDTQ